MSALPFAGAASPTWRDFVPASAGTPLVIDNGSTACRFGFATQEEADLQYLNLKETKEPRGASAFRPLVPKRPNVPFSTAAALAQRWDAALSQAQQGVGRSNPGASKQINLNQLAADSGGVAANFDVQEKVFDQLFGEVVSGLNSGASSGSGSAGSADGVGRRNRKVLGSSSFSSLSQFPVVLTEPVCNPSLARKHMLELLFEGYGVPSVCLGVDALFSLFFENEIVGAEGRAAKGGAVGGAGPATLLQDSLVVSVGTATSHLLPVVGGAPSFADARRFDLGGDHCLGYMQRLSHAKWPAVKADLTPDRITEMTHSHCYVAPTSYAEELNLIYPHFIRKAGAPTVQTVISDRATFRDTKFPRTSSAPSGSSKHGDDDSEVEPLQLNPDAVRVLQLPFHVPEVVELTLEQKAERERQRAERSARLRLMLEERRLRKQVEQEERLVAFEGAFSLRADARAEEEALAANALSEGTSNKMQAYREKVQELGMGKVDDENDDRFMREYFKLKLAVLRGRRTDVATAAMLVVEQEEAHWRDAVQRDRFSLVDVHDDDPRLRTKKMQALKKKQLTLKSMYDGQQRARLAAEASKREREELEAREDESFRLDPDKSLFELRARRAQLLEEKARREKLQQRKLGGRSRHTVASMQRMQILARLATAGNEDEEEGDSLKRKRAKRKGAEHGADEFGDEEGAWDAYLHVQKEKGAFLTDTGEVDVSLLSAEERKEIEDLADVTRLLARFDPEFKSEVTVAEAEAAMRAARQMLDADDEAARAAIREEQARVHREREQQTAISSMRLNMSSGTPCAEDFQITLGAERVRVPEILFNPSLAGIGQMGIAEGIPHVFGSLKSWTEDEAAVRAMGNVFLTGATTSFPRFADRIEHEVRLSLPVGTPIFVRSSSDPEWNAFRGARVWAARAVASDALRRASLFESSYQECGPDYLSEHFFASNCGFPFYV